ncbi:hypothetical protein SSBG_06223 [Streptomyces sp. SPB074]|nr:hypothetical protein SSBG_06223 [Streptomyces sp. SPB074]
MLPARSGSPASRAPAPSSTPFPVRGAARPPSVALSSRAPVLARLSLAAPRSPSVTTRAAAARSRSPGRGNPAAGPRGPGRGGSGLERGPGCDGVGDSERGGNSERAGDSERGREPESGLGSGRGPRGAGATGKASCRATRCRARGGAGTVAVRSDTGSRNCSGASCRPPPLPSSSRRLSGRGVAASPLGVWAMAYLLRPGALRSLSP